MSKGGFSNWNMISSVSQPSLSFSTRQSEVASSPYALCSSLKNSNNTSNNTNFASNHSSGGISNMAAVEKKCKLVLLGEASVGKSSLLLRFVNNEFSETMETTVGAAFFTKTIAVDGKTVRFEIWDTAGQERFATLAPMYYRGASCAVVTYDQTNLHSFERAKVWVEQLQLSANSDIVVALAANKCDLNHKRVDTRDARKYADENGLLFMETSAKTGFNVNNLFLCIARHLPDYSTNKSHMNNNALQNTIRLTADSNNDLNYHKKHSFASRTCCNST